MTAVLVAVFFSVSAVAWANWPSRHAIEYQPAGAAERWGVRGWIMGTNPNIPDGKLSIRVCTASLWIIAEVSGGVQPWVETGFFSGYDAYESGGPTNRPALYVAYSNTGYDADYRQWDFGTVAYGGLHKLAITRTDQNTEGETQWTWYMDGDVKQQVWLDRPDLGHAEAGGECASNDGTFNMAAKARDNGSGTDNRMCIKLTNDNWVEWDTSFSTSTEHDSGTSWSAWSPKWSNFDATN